MQHLIYSPSKGRRYRLLWLVVVCGVAMAPGCSTTSASTGSDDPTVELTEEDLGFNPTKLTTLPEGRFLVCEGTDDCSTLDASFDVIGDFELGLDADLSFEVHGEWIVAYRTPQHYDFTGTYDGEYFYAALYDLEGNRVRAWKEDEVAPVSHMVAADDEIWFVTVPLGPPGGPPVRQVGMVRTERDDIQVERKTGDEELVALVDGDPIYCSSGSPPYAQTQADCRRTGSAEWSVEIASYLGNGEPTVCGENFVVPRAGKLAIRSVRTGERKAVYDLETPTSTDEARERERDSRLSTECKLNPNLRECIAQKPQVGAITCSDETVAIAVQDAPELENVENEIALLSVDGDDVREVDRIDVPYRVSKLVHNGEWVAALTSHQERGEKAIRRIAKLPE